MVRIYLEKELTGSILDIGGGGEGVIGRIYGQKVTAIDNRQEELDEAPDTCKKMLMDASNLDFEDQRFHHVTFFYSLMYMDKDVQQQAISEGARVLHTGGSLHIWDAEIERAYPAPFLAELDIYGAGEVIHTIYGIIKDNAAQNADIFIEMCGEQGLKLIKQQKENGNFYLEFQK